MNSKKAQSEVITTVLIILLVLAAIIIVWQVVQGTVTNASKTASQQVNCMGIGFDVSQATDVSTGIKYLVKRQASGDVIDNKTNALTMVVLVNGATADGNSGYSYTLLNGAATDFKDPLVSRNINITANTSAITKVEVALKVNGNVCGAEGTWTA